MAAEIGRDDVKLRSFLEGLHGTGFDDHTAQGKKGSVLVFPLL